jgi:regulator of replication initiation timing
MDCETPRGKRNSRKRKATPAENGNGTAIWDDNFPFGVFIDKHFITENNREVYEQWGLEKCCGIFQAALIRLVSVARWMEQKVGDLKKSCRDHVEENTKLKNKLSESENNAGEMMRKYEDIVNKLNAENEELQAENKQLKAKAEELKDEMSKQHNAGFNEAVKQFLTSVHNLKP